MGTKTIRQEMIDLLGEFELDALAISQELRIREREVYEHLPHVARSIRGQGRQLIINPPECLKCGYLFEGRTRFTKPGRCPECRETRIQSPTFRIE
ncbi:MAG: transcriptional regulator [Deltaproteobacteria bacterium]|nr:transcriptional regulator [Deltaproteobacteria bacterium]